MSALAEPNRLRIVELLRQGPTPVGEIAERLVLKQPLVSSHLKVLSRAGLVSARPVAQKRLYQLESAPFGEIAAWTATFDALWTERLAGSKHSSTDFAPSGRSRGHQR